jgi:arsenical pump membrane protein
VNGAAAEAAAVALLVLSIAFAVVRPRGISEAVVAVPAAALLVATGVVPLHAVGHTLDRFGPTVGFLAAILLFGHLCAEAGVFSYLSAQAAQTSHGQPRRLLLLVVVLAAVVTATLTLDATVVLLTPVVLATANRLAVPSRPYSYACTRLANSGSLLLPVSNLTNLLAFAATDLSFGRFAALMFAPWLLVCAAEYLGLRVFFRADLKQPGRPDRTPHAAPQYALAVLAVTVALFVLASYLHVAPAWAAVLGCLALLAPRIRRRDITARAVLSNTAPGFCLFVLALAVVVDGVTRHGLADALRHLIPGGTGFFAVLALAFLAAALANLVNNLPATLALVPIVAANPALVLAMLLGVNIGPNAAYPGSLATLLWRRMLPADEKPRARHFHAFGLLTVPVLLVLASAALWGGLQLIGT